MRDISEKVSYLQGLTEGVNLTDGSPQGKIVAGILDVLDEMADMISALRCDFDGMKEYVDDMDDDLCELEESFMMHQDHNVVETECPNCGEELFFESVLLDDDDVIEITCPSCNEVIYINDGSFDFDFDLDPDELETLEREGH